MTRKNNAKYKHVHELSDEILSHTPKKM